MTTKEIIEVIQAFDKGHTIWKQNLNILEDNDFIDKSKEENWDFVQYHYKVCYGCLNEGLVKPYKSREEFMQAQREHGPYFTFGGSYYSPVIISNMFVAYVFDIFIDHESNKFDYRIQFEKYEDLLKSHYWQDGTPCGIIEEEQL